MTGDDRGGRETIWEKRGSKFQVPRIPRPTGAAAWLAVPMVSLAAALTIGLVATPAGPPAPPGSAVAIQPVASIDSVDASPSSDPTMDPTPIDSPSPDETPPPCVAHGHGTGAVPARPSGDSATSVVFEDGSTLWLYDVKTNTKMALVKGDENCWFGTPQFIGRRTVAYLDDGAMRTVDTVTGAIRTLDTTHQKWDWLDRVAVSEDGSKIAVLGGTGGTQFLVSVTSATSGKILFSRKLGYICYCDGDWVPRALTWSRDGAILLVDVPTETDSHKVYVLDRNGKDAVSPREGNYPLWIGPTHTFLYENVAKADSWDTMDVTTGARTTLLKATNLADPALSPDGKRIAFSDMLHLKAEVYDISTKTVHWYGRHQIFPVWLDDDTLAVSGVRTCNCEGLDYTGAGTAIALSTSKTWPLRLTTYDADVLS
jgi:hypothetical protein